MATDRGYRFDLILNPSQYTRVPPPPEEKRGKRDESPKPQTEVFNTFSLPSLTEQRIRDLLMDWVQAKLFCSLSVVRGMIITSVTHDVAYCYKLETYTEQRSVCLRFKPHFKPFVPPPAAWEEPKEKRLWKVMVTPDKMFTNQVLKRHLADTDRVTQCPFCMGEKWVVCRHCYGSTQTQCQVCKRRKPGTKNICTKCKGEGLVPCGPCMAVGRLCCDMCVGRGLLCYFEEMMVEFCCNANHYVFGVAGSTPGNKVAHSVGEILHSARGLKVQPIHTFHINEVNEASGRMVKASTTRWPDCRIVQQRHHLKAVPITRVRYQWRDTAGSVFIYGTDRSIYWPHYPQCREQLCCPCC